MARTGFLNVSRWNYTVHSPLDICLGDCTTEENPQKIGHQEKIDTDILCGTNYACLLHSATIKSARICNVSEKNIRSHLFPLSIHRMAFKVPLIKAQDLMWYLITIKYLILFLDYQIYAY